MTSSMTNYLPILTSLGIAGAVFLALTSWWGVWDSIAERYVADLLPTIRALNIDEERIPVFLRAWGIALLASGGLIFIAPPLSVPCIYLIYIAPRLYLNFLISRREVLIRDQLVGATEALANTSRAGLSLSQGLHSVWRETPSPLSDELRGIVRDYENGLPLPQSINRTKDRLNHDSFTLFAATLLTSLERGGRVTEALERISKSLLESQRLERKMESETASGKRVLLILAVFPLLFLLLFLLVYPEGTLLLFQSVLGQVVLAAVIALIFYSVSMGQKILKLT